MNTLFIYLCTLYNTKLNESAFVIKLIKLLGHCAVHTTKAKQCVTNLYKTINVVTFIGCKKIMLHILSLDNESLHVPPTDLDSVRWMITQRTQEIWLSVLGLHVCIFTSYLNFVDDNVETPLRLQNMVMSLFAIGRGKKTTDAQCGGWPA